MSAVPNRRLKLKTKQLIKACGGLEEASAACEESCRRYSVPQLSRCQNVAAPDYLPIDIVECLEAYCGEPVVTRAMCDARPSAVEAGDLRDELSDVIEGAAPLLTRYRAAMADGHLDAAERADFESALEALVAEVRQAQAAVAAAPSARVRE